MNEHRSVAVIGAGMAGLACAFRLRSAGFRVTVFEQDEIVGGRTRTIRDGGFSFDQGAITLSPAYTETIALLRDAGLGALLHPISPVLAFARGGRLHEVDLQHPVRSMARLRLLSGRAQLKLANLIPQLARYWNRCDFYDMGQLAPLDNETCRAYAMRVLGQEVHDYLVDPLIRVNMFTDTDTSSVVDLIWLLKMFSGTKIVQVEGGMGAMSEGLARGLDVRLNIEVVEVVREGAGVQVRERGGVAHPFDAAVIATPPPIATALAPPEFEPLRNWLKAAEGVEAVTVQVGLSRKPGSRAALVMCPAVDHPDVIALSLDHNKFPDRAPEGKGIVTIHLRADAAAALPGTPEGDTVQFALGAVASLIGDHRDGVEVSHVRRWSYVDHKRRVGVYQALARAQMSTQRPPILYAGEYVSAGVEGAVVSGSRCAQLVIDDAKRHARM